MSVQDDFLQLSELVEERLKASFKDLVRGAFQYHPFVGELYRQLENFVLRRGKRIASGCCLLVYKGYSGKIDEMALRVSEAVELFRHCILVHDDLVDDDEYRRGGPTLHKLFGLSHSQRLGFGVAVFAGGILFSLAVSKLMSSGLQGNLVERLVEVLAGGYRDVNESQVLDLLFEFKEPNAEEWRRMAAKRAASLFKVALLCGGVAAAADEVELNLLRQAAEHMGPLFDIQDDIIDLYANQEVYGRPPGRDITLNKKPLHIVYALQKADAGRNSLKNLLGKPLTAGDLELARELVSSYGALEMAKSDARNYGAKAKEILARTKLSGSAKDALYRLIDYMTESLDWYK